MPSLSSKKIKEACDRCGTCCRQGGPALHIQDRHLVAPGFLEFDVLVTIRRGELARYPLSDRPEPVRQELIKIQGRGRDWSCRFLQAESWSCAIYDRRPLACRLLKCWAPDEVLAIAGRDLLGRYDLIADNDPLLPLVRLHERECACPDLVESEIRLRSSARRAEMLRELEQLVNRDLAVRGMAMQRYGLSVARELFYFGRPLFQLLAPLGVTVTEAAGGLTLQYRGA
ncbi:MAG TPA: YkgJ family cysteine cluster protein [Desulfobacteraceae bacterium]|nr:YkgJ family cysteine cluster protein [Desulfobacteraceae bacterium]